MKKKLHVISFQNPYPPTYGGVIDVFFKLKALKEAGVDVILHTYCYGERMSIDSHLLEQVSEYHIYKRPLGLAKQISPIPYIVNTRKNKCLLNNLLLDDNPILFEGLHTTAFIADPRLKDRKKIVRTHNIEHEYYSKLSESTNNFKEKVFFKIEALRLKHYERRAIKHASCIAAISTTELNYFKNRYPETPAFFLPCFFNYNSSCQNKESINRVLYHGNLSVPENEHSARWIIENVASYLPQTDFVIAGKDPDSSLLTLAALYPNVRIVANPDNNLMDHLVSTSKINLLVTFQATGVKLKLLSALTNGQFVVANSTMVEGSGLGDLCTIANSPGETQSAILNLINQEFYKRATLPKEYIPSESCRNLIEHIYG